MDKVRQILDYANRSIWKINRDKKTKTKTSNRLEKKWEFGCLSIGNRKCCNVQFGVNKSHYMVGSAQLKLHALREPNGVEDGM